MITIDQIIPLIEPLSAGANRSYYHRIHFMSITNLTKSHVVIDGIAYELKYLRLGPKKALYELNYNYEKRLREMI